MEFNDWMRSSGLSESSALKYYSAIEGSLSAWAREAKIINGSILDITDASQMFPIAREIRQLSIFQERNSKGNGMYEAALKQYYSYILEAANSGIEDDIKKIVADPQIEITEKTQLISARIGQGKYRKDLINLWRCCAVTGYADTSILVASHIKPWANSSNAERIDKFNGLLLLPNLDKAFDKYLISFDSSGKILISASLKQAEILGIKPDMSVALTKEHQVYMEHHRENFFSVRENPAEAV